MARIELKALAHAYGRRPRAAQDFALQPLDFVWEDGGAYTLLGPPGCGKTTLLNLISGLTRPSRGQVFFDGRDVTALPPQARNIALVFPFPVVYDRMTVADNLCFPLRNRGIAEDSIRRKVSRIAELLELSADLGRRAGGLAPDARQMVALGRGLVREDIAAVLFDEPLAVIDRHRKWPLRRKLKQIHRELKLTLIYVTDDPVDGLTCADEVVVMAAGRIMQTGTAQALFDDPEHAFVGRFIGSPAMNFLPITFGDGGPKFAGQPLANPAPEQVSRWLAAQQAATPRAELALGIRPEFVTLVADNHPGAIDAEVERVQDLGTTMLITARVGEAVVTTRTPIESDAELALATAARDPHTAGRRLHLSIVNSHSRFFRNQELIR